MSNSLSLLKKKVFILSVKLLNNSFNRVHLNDEGYLCTVCRSQVHTPPACCRLRADAGQFVQCQVYGRS